MAKKKRKSGSQRNRQRNNTPLKAHRRTGKVLQPPFNTIPGIQSVPWLRDTLPDMLWICALISQYGDDGLLIAARCIDRIEDVIDEAQQRGDLGDSAKPMITGELTSFDLVPESLRGEVLARLTADHLFVEAFPWPFVRAMSKYTDCPGIWLSEGWSGHTPIVDAGLPEAFLRRVVEDANHGQSPNATRAKAIALRALFKAGKIHLPPDLGAEWADILLRYPKHITEEERRRIEPEIRATYMAMSKFGDSEDQEGDRPSLAWAKRFWRENWNLYDCTREERPSTDASDPDHHQSIRDARDEWMEALDELNGRFLAVANGTNPDLYAPDRFEVLTGLTYRMVRAAIVLIQFPAMWTMEHGSSTLRALIETRIVLKWLVLRDDEELFLKFKAYGRGRLKLLKLHLEEYRDAMKDPPQELDDHIAYLDALVNRDLMEEFQDISLQGNFAAIDTRRMAEEVGMQTEYRFTFAPASASVHGEWAALDQYVLTVCRNPLHGWHRIPEDSEAVRLGPDLVELTLRALELLISDYEAAVTHDVTSS